MQLEMNMDYISKELNHYNPVVNMFNKEFSLIRYINFLLDQRIVFEPDCLYIGTMDQFRELNTENCPPNFLCIQSDPIYLEGEKNLKTNLILLNTTSNLPEIFNKLQQIFFDHQRYLQFSAKLMNALVLGKGIEQLLEIGYEFLENPMLINDTSFKLIAHIEKKEIDDPFWNDIVQNGYLSAEIINNFKTNKLLERLYKSTYPIYGLWEHSKFKRLITNILVRNKIVGQLLILEYEKPVLESEFQLITLLTNVISTEMQKNKLFFNTRQAAYEFFIADLLEGTIKEREIIKERETHLDLHLKEFLYTVVIDYSLQNNQNTPISNLISIIESIIYGSKSIIFNNHIVMIISRRIGKPLLKDELDKLEEFLDKNNMTAGYSRCFDSLSDLKKNYERSVKALKIGKEKIKLKNIFAYDDIVIYHLLDVYSNEELKEFCHPSIFELIEFDRQHNTNYLLSLYSLISNAKGKIASANSLHIHRNTLSYRLSKIREIIDIDLNNPELLFHIHLSFKILEFIGDIQINSI